MPRKNKGRQPAQGNTFANAIVVSKNKPPQGRAFRKPQAQPKPKSARGIAPQHKPGSGQQAANPQGTHQTQPKPRQMAGSLLSTDLFNASVSYVTTYDDTDFLSVRLASFDPHNADGLATRQAQIWYGLTSHLSSEQLKDLTAAEVTAAQTYLTAILSLMQTLYAMYTLISLCPTFAQHASLVSGDLFNQTDRIAMDMLIDDTQLIYPSWMLDLIKAINPVAVRTVGIMREQNIPPAVHVFWVPSYSVAEMNALRTILTTNQMLFRSVVGKLGIAVSVLKVENLKAVRVSFRPGDRSSYGQFVVRTFHQWGITAAGAISWYYPDDRDPTTAATWFTSYTYYWFEELGGPSDLEAIMTWFHIYDANNPTGVVVTNPGFTTVTPGGATISFAGADRLGIVEIARIGTTWGVETNNAIAGYGDVSVGAIVNTTALVATKAAVVGTSTLFSVYTHWSYLRTMRKPYPSTLLAIQEIFWKKISMGKAAHSEHPKGDSRDGKRNSGRAKARS